MLSSWYILAEASSREGHSIMPLYHNQIKVLHTWPTICFEHAAHEPFGTVIIPCLVISALRFPNILSSDPGPPTPCIGKNVWRKKFAFTLQYMITLC